MTVQDRAFGRIESPDAKDRLFPVSTTVPSAPAELTEKYWWADGWWGDQGSSTHCVAYSWLHLLEDGPVVQDGILGTRNKPIITPAKLYAECQLRDPWAGENYPGTSIRAGAKVLKDLGAIAEYRWANTVSDIINTLLMIGPMVVGTKWYNDMSTPNSSGVMRVSGREFGGHAYLINGVNLKSGMFRIKNSWGRSWGRQGYAFVKISEFEKLFRDGGEACICFEKKLSEGIDWSKLRAPGVYQ